MILITHWYYAVSFSRYFTGPGRWMTLPPLTDYSIHRYDLLKKRMALPDPIQPVLDAMASTLQSGNRVLLIGNLAAPTPGMDPIVFRPAPLESFGWNEGAYTASWRAQAGHFLQLHAMGAKTWLVPEGRGVSMYENVPLVSVWGWRD
jgi:hypothetical protein